MREGTDTRRVWHRELLEVGMTVTSSVSQMPHHSLARAGAALGCSSVQVSPGSWERLKAAVTPMFGEPHTPSGEMALVHEALQLLVGWNPPGL